jgi:hypothetical protein
MSAYRQPVFAMLAQLLIAYTYDFDAALERAIGRTDAGEKPPSLAMWANVLQFVGDEGVDLATLSTLSGIAKPSIKSMVSCLERHRWISIDEKGAARLTALGTKAKRAWKTTLDAVEREWEAKLGTQTMETLRATLESAKSQLDRDLPQYPMPAPHRGAFPTGE